VAKSQSGSSATVLSIRPIIRPESHCGLFPASRGPLPCFCAVSCAPSKRGLACHRSVAASHLVLEPCAQR
jgi:hypothetical protein